MRDVIDQVRNGDRQTITATLAPAAVCERCARPSDVHALWTLSIAVPPEPAVQRTICAECAASVRDHLLSKPASNGHGPAEPQKARLSEAPRSRRAEVNAFFLRGFVYLNVATAVFLLVTFLTLR
ncbi:MAG: hypothetical protein ICV59_09360 [Thermoleophilia bacterium]|nr:hypothetical protein [Thermoleophilia bacterium]